MSTPQLTEFRALLDEIFQFDRADLDFGLYRILNQKREEIQRFFDHQLVPHVEKALAGAQKTDTEALKNELAEAEKQGRALGLAPDGVANLPKVRELRAKLDEADKNTLKPEAVFSALTEFFRRYYDKGDFLSRPLYRKGVYAIPYEGQEVKLHFANADQYYVKTGEHFKDYAFTLNDGKTVRFALVEASVERDNNKAQNGKDRCFVFQKIRPTDDANTETLTLEFAYLVPEPVVDPATGKPKKPKQEDLNREATNTILADLEAAPFLEGLAALKGTEKQPKRTVLEAKLADYTARNKFDYFIHKDLGGFLHRELDFYIKSEVVSLDDLTQTDPEHLERTIRKARAIRAVAESLIMFLAQLEDFQKHLFLKKKFVVECGWCVTLDRVPKVLWESVRNSTAQVAEWKRLYAIEEHTPTTTQPTPWSEPPSLAFLEEHPHLMVDTQFFDTAFSEALVGSWEDVEAQTDGVIVNSENLQALNLLKARYSGYIDCIYIDPPYNAKTSKILYKNDYEHSSWLCLMNDRLISSKNMLNKNNTIIIAIDENEQERLGMLLSDIFNDRKITAISVIHNPRGIQGSGFSYNHETAYFIYNEGRKLPKKTLSTEKEKPLMKTGSVSLRNEGPTMFYPIYIQNEEIIAIGTPSDETFHPGASQVNEENGIIAIYPVDSSGTERKWRYSSESLKKVIDNLDIRIGRNGQYVIYLAKNSENFKTVWQSPEYNAAEHGSTLLKHMNLGDFSFPKSIYTVSDSIKIGKSDLAYFTMDFFAGSGTTGHAIIEATRNRIQTLIEDGEDKTDFKEFHRYILVETNTYFDTVLKPRLQKAVYSPTWKNGKPQTRDEGISHTIKYLRLESYEDALNNLELNRSAEVQAVLEEEADTPGVLVDYYTRYMTRTEQRGSKTLGVIEALEEPFDYTLKVAHGDVGATVEKTVDVVETFHYLLGLRVERHFAIEGVRVSVGTTARGEKVMTLWRSVRAVSDDALTALWKRENWEERFAPQTIYVNGPTSLQAHCPPTANWRVLRSEHELHRLMNTIEEIK